MVSLFVWNLTLNLSDLRDPASSYATVGLALGFIGTRKPRHHDKGGDAIGGASWGIKNTISLM
jgi:hypothetical protein